MRPHVDPISFCFSKSSSGFIICLTYCLFVCFVFLLWFDDFLLYYASVLLLLVFVNLFYVFHQWNYLEILIEGGSPASSFYLCFSGSMSLGETIIYYGLGGLYLLGSSMCIMSRFNSFWCESCFLLWILVPLFSVYAGHYPLDRRCHSCCGDQSLPWILSRASSFFCGSHLPVRGRDCFLTVGAESLIFVSELHLWVVVLGRWDRSNPSVKGARVFLHWSCSLVSVLCCVTFHLLCGLTKYAIVGIALDPTSVVRMLTIGPSVPQALFSQGHQCRSTEDKPQDLSSRSPGPSVGVLGASQTLAQWPSQAPACMYPQSP